MKNIIILLGIIFTISLAFSQKEQKAPFGGKIITDEQNPIIVLEHKDGSEITRFSDGKWYLTKESDRIKKSSVPSWVAKSSPKLIIYESSNGNQYFTSDGYYWKKLPISSGNAFFERENKAQEKPESFIAFDKLTLTLRHFQKGFYRISIYDLQSNLILEKYYDAKSSYPQVEIEVSNLRRGTYFYVITNGITYSRGIFIKY